MKADIYADFWKEQFVHLLHKNMTKVDAEPLVFENAKTAFDRFAFLHPEIQTQIEFSQNYVTWECFLTPSVKIRLYIQNQIKATLLQKNGGDYIKLADAKFPYNPFPEIAELIKNKDALLVELDELEENAAKKERQLKLLKEFIKARLEKKYPADSKTYYIIEETASELIVTVNFDDKSIKYSITPENYLQNFELL